MLFFHAEFTTMAGRRLHDAVKMVLTSGASKEFGRNVHVVISGLTNTYSQYVTTFEEYEVQRYEVCHSFPIFHNLIPSYVNH
jgi:neutral ceramidase